MSDLELLARVWVGGDDGDLVRCVIEAERVDRDEVRIGVVEDDETTHVYVDRDRALKLGHALIEHALAEWRLP